MNVNAKGNRKGKIIDCGNDGLLFERIKVLVLQSSRKQEEGRDLSFISHDQKTMLSHQRANNMRSMKNEKILCVLRLKSLACMHGN